VQIERINEDVSIEPERFQLLEAVLIGRTKSGRIDFGSYEGEHHFVFCR
jgi:hypothetical protein